MRRAAGIGSLPAAGGRRAAPGSADRSANRKCADARVDDWPVSSSCERSCRRSASSRVSASVFWLERRSRSKSPNGLCAGISLKEMPRARQVGGVHDPWPAEKAKRVAVRVGKPLPLKNHRLLIPAAEDRAAPRLVREFFIRAQVGEGTGKFEAFKQRVAAGKSEIPGASAGRYAPRQGSGSLHQEGEYFILEGVCPAHHGSNVPTTRMAKLSWSSPRSRRVSRSISSCWPKRLPSPRRGR